MYFLLYFTKLVAKIDVYLISCEISQNSGAPRGRRFRKYFEKIYSKTYVLQCFLPECRSLRSRSRFWAILLPELVFGKYFENK